MSMEDTNEYIKEQIGRKVVLVGASTGTDAHTVGIDAITAAHTVLASQFINEAFAKTAGMREEQMGLGLSLIHI